MDILKIVIWPLIYHEIIFTSIYIDIQEIKYGTEAFPSWIKTIDGRNFNFVSHDRKEHLRGRKTTPGASQLMGCNCYSFSISRQ
jgi:hypothetical protein